MAKTIKQHLKTSAVAVMLGAATIGAGTGLTSCSKEDKEDIVKEQANNLSYTITDAQSLSSTLDKIAADLYKIAKPAWDKAERVDVTLNIKVNEGALKFVYSEDFMKLGAMLEGKSGVLPVDDDVSRKIIDFYGIEHLSVNLTGDKNALIYPDLMEKNGHHAVPDYDYDACYNRSVYLLRRAGFNVVEKPGLEMAAASINQSKGRTFVITPEMFAAEAKNKKGRA